MRIRFQIDLFFFIQKKTVDVNNGHLKFWILLHPWDHHIIFTKTRKIRAQHAYRIRYDRKIYFIKAMRPVIMIYVIEIIHDSIDLLIRYFIKRAGTDRRVNGLPV